MGKCLKMSTYPVYLSIYEHWSLHILLLTVTRHLHI